MSMRIGPRSLITGSAIALMLIGMFHMALTSQSALAGTALALFIGIHVAIISGIAAVGWWAARVSPALRARITRIHKPDAAHLFTMLAAALFTAVIVHLINHGSF